MGTRERMTLVKGYVECVHLAAWMLLPLSSITRMDIHLLGVGLEKMEWKNCYDI